ncbi:Peroxiredoxin [Humidesulfovibrio mexicanus]|uniref:Peroxiredoxin n=1 Tax=Humidesulfovibrio mexicanus TaxID=147047 RepID=A0A238YYF5_9BACT|nr:TlpA disulfide reductase family protein [Humidesulfovibrio mexicanus]SNR76246.1 Peroxiredoxin [Humidesulfovibrio mexicanus]
MDTPTASRISALLLALLLALSALPALAAKPRTGDILPDEESTARLAPPDAAALGLSPDKPLRLSQIKARTLLVEVYSMYCPICQTVAPAVNRVHERLAASPLGREIGFVALGAGNSPFEIEVFRKKYRTPFPLVPDPDYVLHKAFMSVGTPAFFVLRPLPGGKGLKVLLYHEGPLKDEDAFVEQVLRAAAQK